MSYDPLPPWRRDFNTARDPYTARNALGIPEPTGGAPAPASAEYITKSADATLTNERVLTNTATVTWDFATAGQAKANATGFGNVSNSGTPTAGQLARWVTSTTIEGVSLATAGIQPLDATLTALAAYNTNGLLTQTAADTFTGRTLTGPAAGITVSNGNGVAGNPTLALANDLAAIEALAGTNTIYYRSGTDAWSAVTIAGSMTFSGGSLAAYGGQLPGTATNDNASAGNVGEYVEGVRTSSLALTASTVTEVVNISLTAGDWDVSGMINFTMTGTATTCEIDINTTVAFAATPRSYCISGSVTLGNFSMTTPVFRMSQAGAFTARLITRVSLGGGTAVASASIRARRVR